MKYKQINCVDEYNPPGEDEGAWIGSLRLNPKYAKALQDWLPPTEPLENVLETAGYWRNVARHATNDGIRLLAFMAAEGLLKPEEDPVEVLRDLMERASDGGK